MAETAAPAAAMHSRSQDDPRAREQYERDREALFALIKERSFATGDFTLSSGKKSSLYFDLKPTMMSSQGARLCGRVILHHVRQSGCGFIGGLEMGAVPIISVVAALSPPDAPVEAFFVRKAAKAHGTGKIVEGFASPDALAGRSVVIAEDVTTSGGSALQAIEAARRAGATVKLAVTLVDREEGARELLADAGVELVAVFRAREFL